MKTYSIYRIVNFRDGKIYVGKTAKPKGRKRDHFSKLRSGKHCNPQLQAAFDEFGSEAFFFEILESNVSSDLAGERERYWVHYFDSFNKGYNLTNSGQGKSEIACSWNGINYASIKDCADANGVGPATMIFRFQHGYRSDDDMYGSGRKTACTWNGVEYRSIRGAARQLGIPYPTLQAWIAKGYRGDEDRQKVA